MTKKKIIIIFLILAVIFFGFYILKGERFRKTNIFQNNTEKNNNSENTGAINQNDDANNDTTIAPNIEVGPADCDNECKNLKKTMIN
jgi:capsule polysaccharide export protein KpsE/RkpR